MCESVFPRPLADVVTPVGAATPSGDVSTAYAYPAAGTAQPHTLSSTTVTSSTGTTTSTYGYAAAGNTLSRPGPNGRQTLSWDAEGRVNSVADASGTTSFLYDADVTPRGLALFLAAGFPAWMRAWAPLTPPAPTTPASRGDREVRASFGSEVVKLPTEMALGCRRRWATT